MDFAVTEYTIIHISFYFTRAMGFTKNLFRFKSANNNDKNEYDKF